MQLYGHLKPPALGDSRRTAGRVRLEMMGGAVGRGNSVPMQSVQGPVVPEFRIERE